MHAASVAGQARSPDSANAAAREFAPPRDNARAIPLTDVSLPAWQSLAERAAEPNACYLPEWELAVNAFSSGRTDVSALSSHADSGEMIGLMPGLPSMSTRLSMLHWKAVSISEVPTKA